VQWLGFRQACVEYDRRSRRAGVSKWPVARRFGLAWNWIIAFSGIPLRLITITGMLMAAGGFVYAAFLVVYALTGRTIPGFATTVVLLVVLNGIQMTMLGVLGEYLWRNIEEARRRPLFFIEKETGGA
jgi:dolichol-phosphate mannosyltransferase